MINRLTITYLASRIRATRGRVPAVFPAFTCVANFSALLAFQGDLLSDSNTCGVAHVAECCFSDCPY